MAGYTKNQKKYQTENKLTDMLRKNIVLDYITTFVTNLNMQSSIWVLYLAYCGLNLAQIGRVTRTEIRLRNGDAVPLPRGAYEGINRAIINMR